MNQYLPFNLPEEIFRLNSASPYEAFVLKAKIEEYLEATKIVRTAKENISYGSKLKYFDTEKMDVDGINIENIDGDFVSGIRLSDSAKVTVPIESLSLLEPLSEVKEQERKDLDGFNVTPLSRVAVAQWNYGKTYLSGKLLMLGYLIRHSHSTSKIRLLGGELINLKYFTYRLYHPTSEEMQQFDKVESDAFFIEKELNRTVTLAKECAKDLDVSFKQSIAKISRFLLVRGCTQENITRATSIIQSNCDKDSATNEACLTESNES